MHVWSLKMEMKMDHPAYFLHNRQHEQTAKRQQERRKMNDTMAGGTGNNNVGSLTSSSSSSFRRKCPCSLEVLAYPNAEFGCERLMAQLSATKTTHETTIVITLSGADIRDGGTVRKIKTATNLVMALWKEEQKQHDKKKKTFAVSTKDESGDGRNMTTGDGRNDTSTSAPTPTSATETTHIGTGVAIESFSIFLRESTHALSAHKPLSLPSDLAIALTEFFQTMAACQRNDLNILIDRCIVPQQSNALISFIMDVAGTKLNLIRGIETAHFSCQALVQYLDTMSKQQQQQQQQQPEREVANEGEKPMTLTTTATTTTAAVDESSSPFCYLGIIVPPQLSCSSKVLNLLKALEGNTSLLTLHLNLQKFYGMRNPTYTPAVIHYNLYKAAINKHGHQTKTSLRSLSISWSIPCPWILEIIKDHPTLEYLSIRYVHNSYWSDFPKQQEATMKALAAILSSPRCKIKELEICGSTSQTDPMSVPPPGTESEMRQRRRLHRNPPLRSPPPPPLFLPISSVGGTTAAATAAVAAENNNDHDEEYNDDEVPPPLYERLLRGNQSLRRLTLNHVGLTTETVDDLLCFLFRSGSCSCPRLKILDVQGNRDISTLDFDKFLHLAAEHRQKTMNDCREGRQQEQHQGHSSSPSEPSSSSSFFGGLALEELRVDEQSIIRWYGPIESWMEPMWGQYRMLEACPRLYSFGSWDFARLWHVFEARRFAELMSVSPPPYPEELVMLPSRLQYMADINLYRPIFLRLVHGKVSASTLPTILAWLKRRAEGMDMSKRRQADMLYHILRTDPAMLASCLRPYLLDMF